jgi:GNAT superfamily N-acetyltransferase
VEDPSAWFDAAELEGEVVGVQRLRPLAPALAWYEGLRVASSHRRQGIGSAMVAAALDQARELGFGEVRLATFDPDARRFFEALGFGCRLQLVSWVASRIEGDEPAALPTPDQVPKIFGRLQEDPGYRAYGGLNADPDGALDLDVTELQRLAAAGRLRQDAGAGSLAIVKAAPTRQGARLMATFLSGQGTAVRDLLAALRFEADTDGLRGVVLTAPADHPARARFEEVAYTLRTQPPSSWAIYARRL